MPGVPFSQHAHLPLKSSAGSSLFLFLYVTWMNAVLKLLQCGSPLHAAAQHGHTDILRALLSAPDADMEAQDSVRGEGKREKEARDKRNILTATQASVTPRQKTASQQSSVTDTTCLVWARRRATDALRYTSRPPAAIWGASRHS